MKYGFDIKAFATQEQLKGIETQALSTGKFQAIELYYGHDMMDMDFTNFYNTMKHFVREYDLESTIHLQPYNFVDPSKAIQKTITEEIEKGFEFAKEVNCNLLVIHGGRAEFNFAMPIEELEPLRIELRPVLAAKIQELCDIAKGYGLTLALENLTNLNDITLTAEDLLSVKELVNRDNLTLTFDCGHAHMHGYDVVDFVQKLGKHIGHTHLHDNHGFRDEHLVPGRGTIPWQAMIQALKAIDYNGIYLFELSNATGQDALDSHAFISKYF